MKKEAEPLGIIIATHGKLGQELIRSAKMIFGEFDRVTPVALEEGMSPEDYYSRLKTVCEQYGGKALILADIFSGTPFRVSALLGREMEIHLITGVNMPMLIDAVQLRSTKTAEDFVKTLAEYGRESIQIIGEV